MVALGGAGQACIDTGLHSFVTHSIVVLVEHLFVMILKNVIAGETERTKDQSLVLGSQVVIAAKILDHVSVTIR